MVVEITKEQKTQLAEKIGLCVDFLKKEVQPHLVPTDTVSVVVSDELELFITSKKLYVKVADPLSLGFVEIPVSRIVYLEKQEKSKKKKYICEFFPELAVEFLKNWNKTKDRLINEIATKVKKEEDLNNFIDSFKL